MPLTSAITEPLPGTSYSKADTSVTGKRGNIHGIDACGRTIRGPQSHSPTDSTQYFPLEVDDYSQHAVFLAPVSLMPLCL